MGSTSAAVASDCRWICPGARAVALTVSVQLDLCIAKLPVAFVVNAKLGRQPDRSEMESSEGNSRPLSEGLKALLKARGMSIRELARRTETTPSHLSRVMREVDGKRSSASLARRVAVALEVPVDHFAEARIETIIDRLRADPKLRDEVYRLVSSRS